MSNCNQMFLFQWSVYYVDLGVLTFFLYDKNVSSAYAIILVNKSYWTWSFVKTTSPIIPKSPCPHNKL